MVQHASLSPSIGAVWWAALAASLSFLAYSVASSGNLTTSLISQGLFYGLAGALHFLLPKFYLRIMPRFVPFPEFVNVVVGVIEVLLGAFLLRESTRQLAALGIVLLLVAVYPANINHFLDTKNFMTAARLPLQGLAIYWAYIYA